MNAAAPAHLPQWTTLNDCKTRMLHTGHYDDMVMKPPIFAALGIPGPDIKRDVGADSHARQIAKVLRKCEAAMDRVASHAVAVGYCNSMLACGVVPSKRALPVAQEGAARRIVQTMQRWLGERAGVPQ